MVSGTVEYVTEVDGNEFVMKNLEAGSVINQRNFVVDDVMYINIRCKTNVKVLILETEAINEVRSMFPDLARILNIRWSALNRHINKYPLDYIDHN